MKINLRDYFQPLLEHCSVSTMKTLQAPARIAKTHSFYWFTTFSDFLFDRFKIKNQFIAYIFLKCD